MAERPEFLLPLGASCPLVDFGSVHKQELQACNDAILGSTCAQAIHINGSGGQSAADSTTVPGDVAAVLEAPHKPGRYVAANHANRAVLIIDGGLAITGYLLDDRSDGPRRRRQAITIRGKPFSIISGAANGGA